MVPRFASEEEKQAVLAKISESMIFAVAVDGTAYRLENLVLQSALVTPVPIEAVSTILSEAAANAKMGVSS